MPAFIASLDVLLGIPTERHEVCTVLGREAVRVQLDLGRPIGAVSDLFRSAATTVSRLTEADDGVDLWKRTSIGKIGGDGFFRPLVNPAATF